MSLSTHLPISINREFLIDVLQTLIRVDSTNPSLSPDGSGEQDIVRAVGRIMSELEMGFVVHEQTSGRPSIVGRLTGRGHGRTLLLNAHLDTVGVSGMADPFSGRIDPATGRCYGRGAVDMKGSMAAQLAAAEAIRAAKITLNGDLLIAGVADEEFASLGVQEIIPQYSVDGVIVTEPSDLQISVAHKGFIWLELRTFGKAYHGSRPDLGVDANMHMGHVLGRLADLEQTLRRRTPHPLLGSPSLHAATIHGGSEWSAYAARCILQVERRTLPGETAAAVKGEIDAILAELHHSVPDFHAEVEIKLVRDPFEASPDSALVPALRRSADRVLLAPPSLIGQKFWTDAAFHAAAGADTVLIGPTGHGLHAEEEWVDIDSVIALAEILGQTAIEYCGAGAD